MAEHSKDHTVPPWMLAPTEETEVRKRHQAWMELECADTFKAFAQCSTANPYTFPFKCKTQKRAMIDCVAKNGSFEVYDDFKRQYVAEKVRKIEERAATEDQ